jgi:hypothetical protein
MMDEVIVELTPTYIHAEYLMHANALDEWIKAGME